MQEEVVMREMTDAELAGAAEITDDMLVLGDLAELPPPGDEAGLRKLGVNLTCDPQFSTKSLFLS